MNTIVSITIVGSVNTIVSITIVGGVDILLFDIGDNRDNSRYTIVFIAILNIYITEILKSQLAPPCTREKANSSVCACVRKCVCVCV